MSKKKGKDKKKEIFNFKNVVLSFNFISSFLLSIAIIFSPDAGAIGLPLSLFIIPTFIFFVANLIFFFGYLIKFNKTKVVRAFSILVIIILSFLLNGLLTKIGLKDLKNYAVKLQKACELNQKCPSMDPPWTKDWGQVKISSNKFSLSLTHFEDYWFIQGGYNKDLTMEIAPDHGERSKFIYKNNEWVKIK